MAIGETILGAVLQVVSDRLASQRVINFFKSSKLDKSLIEKLKHLMLAAEKLLADAEEKQIADAKVKVWLKDLKHLFYRAEEIMNEIDLSPEPESFVTKVRNLIPAFSSSSSFVKNISSEIQDVVTHLDHMVSISAALNLREGSGNTASRRVSTTYMLEDSGVFGREQEKEELLNFLFSEEAERNRISVVAIVGMGGMGKTTLAKLVYNDGSLGSFDLKAWVYVSEQLDISRVTKSILESITCQSYSGSLDLNHLQHKLSLELKGKRFFLVLDDVWNENYEGWECLRAPLTVGACGSKIIVTTRNGEVASIMRTAPVICLKPLSDKDGWSLFSKHAFQIGNSSSNPRIEFLGKNIVNKCHGLPLAIKTLGGLLRSEQDIKKWEAILQSSLWDLPDNKSNVAPALRLSYYHLPSHLKQCFSYCSIFPKGYELDRKTLVLLWMAENFVQPTDTKRRIEDTGEVYLNQLLSQSFFDKKENFVVMHDLMHDLALAVSEEFVARLRDGDTAPNISEKTRHFSYSQSRLDSFTKFENLHAAKYLRTFIPLQSWKSWVQFRKIELYGCYLSNKIPAVMIPKFSCLHVLSLSKYIVLKLPESIVNLRQLRYLDVSETRIKELPESVSSLCKLQTLLLSGCEYLERLPADMSRLVSLRHLDISKTTSLAQMPKHMSKLKQLQTLSGFVVSKHCDQGIEELRELQHIRGKLALRSLQNISSSVDALEANLSCREYVNDVALEFDEKDCGDSVKGREVLENLKPHANLERLVLKSYPGTRFPSWLDTQCSMYKRIVDLRLSGCKYCCYLPPLGQLPSLEYLEILGMDHIVVIGSEFYAYESGHMSPFPVLQSLVIKFMEVWKRWSGLEIEGRLPFPCLEKLELVNCPELEGDLPVNLASLKGLKIENCGSLEISLLTPTLASTPIEWTEDRELWQLAFVHRALGRLFHLTRLELVDLKQLVSLPPQIALLSCLETMHLYGLGKLKSLVNVRLPTNLQNLSIFSCKILECLPKEMDLHNHLQVVSIRVCPNLKWAPEDTLPASLQSLSVLSCESCDFPIPILIERMQKYSSLDWLFISDINSSLVSFPLGAIPNLRNLALRGLRNLETVYIPRGTDLINLTSLQLLSIVNCRKLKWIGKTEEDGVVDLPTPNLIRLHIWRCGIVKPLMGDRECLPSKLQTLNIGNFNTITSHGNPRSLLMFFSLRKLRIHGHDVQYFPDNVSLPVTLIKLTLNKFPNLRYLDGEALKTLISLRKFHVWRCPNLQCLPDEGLPLSLGYLEIRECPLLEKRCQRDTGLDWPKIDHIPRVDIDGILI